ncbi:MAG: DNA repair protein RadA, partial [Tissierellales bacterium]
GGLRLREQSANLAVIMSIASSVFKKGIPGDVAFIADVGLTGELKKVPSMDMRIKELERMGFKKVIIPKYSLKQKLELDNIEVIEFRYLTEVIEYIFS